MTLKIDIKSDIRAVERHLFDTQKRKLPSAISGALNKTNTGIITDGVRAVSDETGITPQRRLRRRIVSPRALRATRRRLKAAGLILFDYVPEIYLVPEGVKARRAAQGRNKFLARMPQGHLGLFRRKTDKRLPIKEFLVDISSRVVPEMKEVVNHAGKTRWPKEFRRAMARVLR